MKDSIIIIPLQLYHIHVIITHGVTIETAYHHAKKHGCTLDEKWLASRKRLSEGAQGLCTTLGDGNRDVLVWIAKRLTRSSKCSEYGVLVHELFHAVDRIRNDMHAEDETELGAYLFEHLFESACKVFWAIPPSTPKKTKKKKANERKR